MCNNRHFANSDTPTPGSEWIGMSASQRLARLNGALAMGMPALGELVVITSVKDDGQVIVSLKEQLPADKRGTVLLDIEAFLKDTVDQGLAVWLEGLGDKNSLRNQSDAENKSKRQFMFRN